jgi:dTDP-L-rhamnose 4-epimerase
MRILVTGGAGFIGSFTVDELVRSGHEVAVFDNLDPRVHPASRAPKYINKEARLIKGDVRDYGRLKRALKGCDVVFHFAASVGVGQSQYQIKKYTDVAIGGTANLLDILVNTRNRVRKIIVAASMSSYGEGLYECAGCGRIRPGMRKGEDLKKKAWEPFCPQCGRDIKPVAIDERRERQCNSIYAITKMTQEEMVMNICGTYRIPGVALRYFNVYGPRQALSNPYTGVCAIFLSRIKNSNPPVVYEDGLQTRDFISIHDIVRANMLAMNRNEADYKVFNAGSGNPIAIKKIAEVLIELSGKCLKPRIADKYRKGDTRHCFADISKIKKTLNFTPRVDFKDGMAELIEWSGTQRAKDGFEKAKAELKKKGLL